MVLIKVVQLVVHIDRSRDVFFNIDFNYAFQISNLALRIVLFRQPLYLLAQDIERDADCEEDHTKDPEDDHGRAERRYGSPRWQHLLLELALLQLIYLFLDASEVVVRYFHFLYF